MRIKIPQYNESYKSNVIKKREKRGIKKLNVKKKKGLADR